ncbi:transcriptional regulator [Citrobacter amalonaticus]|uniref:Transcriptional regulator n=1 Tax=Citrobacter amalonaticus TaxID=35703 RepID=A0A2S4RYB0_CITAM|nr:PapB/FocB family fimbrial expression transcriptional regulator [Citrobacter amalonaticus]POT57828.1 transcriptional regulator [Citrobacter amalonaticus]POT76645.1 transcriptional regulator [Citrobacter amalonaticus]POU65724.1 transcriptional regulator [Citrobacter amalonaticus]POV05881.1 transcriptional regulator [Citrobacter amalonaticus]
MSSHQLINTLSHLHVFSTTLIPGKVSASYFRLLTRIYAIHSNKMLGALEYHLVYGYTRMEACNKTGATQSYFSVKLRELKRIHQTIIELYQKCYPSCRCGHNSI